MYISFGSQYTHQELERLVNGTTMYIDTFNFPKKKKKSLIDLLHDWLSVHI